MTKFLGLPRLLKITRLTDRLLLPIVFETELMGIEGVPKPESIVTKSATDSPASKASEAAETATEKLAEKIASKVADAADAAKTIVADTDDVQAHNEL